LFSCNIRTSIPREKPYLITNILLFFDSLPSWNDYISREGCQSEKPLTAFPGYVDKKPWKFR
ncbi:hypothetical protein, partial [Cytobacillus praedii]|uniref:hypothetical protein n=1 Tax=Cytobacillus praedii TaxID=1742358 RepID=UPI001E4F7D05